MSASATPFLMFQGQAKEAMDFYVSLFPGGKIDECVLDGGRVARGFFTVAGLRLRAFDSPVEHAFGFTPRFSLFIECESEAQLRDAAAKLLDGGQALMPVGSYGFSKLFAWVSDRFGVSWQLNVA